VFNVETVVFNDFLNDFKSSFFDHNRRHRAEVAFQKLRQTGTVSAYMQEFNQHAHTVGWANTPLMSLNEKIHLAMVMSNIEFDSLRSIHVMALKGQTIEGIWKGRPAPNPFPSTSTSAPAPEPNVMDLSAFQKAQSN
ncbi:uncharacterized protein VP01_8539g1, partial [Puccinia sorghi]